MLFLYANHFTFDLSLNVAYASLIPKKAAKAVFKEHAQSCTADSNTCEACKDRYINKFLGSMKGFVFGIGYCFDFPKVFVEWNFLNVGCGIGQGHLLDENGNVWNGILGTDWIKKHYFKDFKNSAVSVDASIMLLKIGRFIAPNVSLYGMISPCTFIFANVEAECSNMPNFGITIGAGARFFFHKHWAVQVEWAFLKSYFSDEWRDKLNVTKGIEPRDFESKIAINRFTIGVFTRT